MNFEMEMEKAINDICNKRLSDVKKGIFDHRIYYHTAFRNNKQFKAYGGKYEPLFKKWYLLSNNPNIEIVDTVFTRIEFIDQRY